VISNRLQQFTLSTLVAKINNSMQIRIPHRRESSVETRRRLFLSFFGRMLRFVYLDAEDANRVIGFGSKEPLTLRLLDLLGPGDVFLDVGASIGIYSIPAAAKVGATGRVIAVEADPRKATKLAHNVEINHFQGRINVERVVAGEVSSADSGERTLDSVLVSKQYPDPTVIKIDVDGPELQVLRGLQSTIRTSSRLRLLQVEFSDSNVELIEYLRGLGFKLVDFETYRNPKLFMGASITGNGWFVRRQESLT